MAGRETRTVTLDVMRYRPEQDAEPVLQRYEVPARDHWVVLDALQYIKDHMDGTLSFRWSCHMGICGSCGMMINGQPTLSCSRFLRDCPPGPIRVEPLANFPIARDLVINLEDFLEKLNRVRPWLLASSEPVDEEYSQTPAELDQYHQFSLCINCMLCYAACPVYGQHPEFIGPAAIALAQRYNLDSRDDGAAARAEVLASEHGVWQCTFVGQCSEVCPANVDPAGAIQQAKLTTAKQWVRSLLWPWGTRAEGM